ncbi:hypothetical protein [Crocinitomix catalasitica]|nr:hypothetical protein [Crocinitomix catalasitica]
MRKLITAILFIPLLSCSINKESTESNTEIVANKSTTGIIRDKSMLDCGFLIEIKIDDNLTLLEPLSLPENYNSDGMSIKFDYAISRRTSTCSIAMPIIINEIFE